MKFYFTNDDLLGCRIEAMSTILTMSLHFDFRVRNVPKGRKCLKSTEFIPCDSDGTIMDCKEASMILKDIYLSRLSRSRNHNRFINKLYESLKED